MTVYAVLLCQKPVCGTYASNVLEQGCGALVIDGCRVGTTKQTPGSPAKAHRGFEGKAFAMKARSREKTGFNGNIGRWPANVVLGHGDCRRLGTKSVKGDGHFPASRGKGGLSTSGHHGQNGLDERNMKEENVVE